MAEARAMAKAMAGGRSITSTLVMADEVSPRPDYEWDEPPPDDLPEGAITADGFARLGTNREILSWYGGDPLAKTEAQEAASQADLKAERESFRNEKLERQFKGQRQKAHRKAGRECTFNERQEQWRSAEEMMRQREAQERRAVLTALDEDKHRHPSFGTMPWHQPLSSFNNTPTPNRGY